jgi:hypothetical protein
VKLRGFFSLKGKFLGLGYAFGRLLSDPNSPFNSQSGRVAIAAAVKVEHRSHCGYRATASSAFRQMKSESR